MPIHFRDSESYLDIDVLQATNLEALKVQLESRTQFNWTVYGPVHSIRTVHGPVYAQQVIRWHKTPGARSG